MTIMPYHEMCYTFTTNYDNNVLVNIICLILKNSDIRFEMPVSRYTSFIGKKHFKVLKQNGSCTTKRYITRQSVRDCKPTPRDTDRNRNPGAHPTKYLKIKIILTFSYNLH